MNALDRLTHQLFEAAVQASLEWPDDALSLFIQQPSLRDLGPNEIIKLFIDHDEVLAARIQGGLWR